MSDTEELNALDAAELEDLEARKESPDPTPDNAWMFL
jgi:hypothetical protein